jgi:hypothetical protein
MRRGVGGETTIIIWDIIAKPNNNGSPNKGKII